MLKISVICPYYKGEKYLKQYLQRVEGMYQQLLPFNIELECIIDVNLPNENELKILKYYTDLDYEYKEHTPIKVLISKDKLYNWSESANRCLKEAMGKFITLWGIDDIRTLVGFLAQAEAIETDNDLGAISGDFYIISEYDFKRTDNRVFHESYHQNNAKYSGMVFGPFFMFRRSILDTIGYFDEQLKSGGDYDFIMRLVRKFKTSHLPLPLGYYLNDGTGNSTNPNSLQPIERTVIELRYNLSSKHQTKELIDKAKEYDIDNLYWNNKKWMNMYKLV